ncbi:MAG: yecA family protein [Alteromonadaceae bacterium]|jgi:yecA family protein|tara:strand:- start:6315 stop:6896 length:582 start_codon:yes stop_codon:yes gene_type:complete
MSDNNLEENILDFASVQAIITTESVQVHAAELHGVLTGLVCAGFPFESHDYLAMITDLFNDGENLPVKVKAIVKLMFSDIWKNILDDSYGFQLMLPDDDDSIVERGHALSVWVQGFNLGFGLHQKDKAIVSGDVKEVLSDFAEIANLSDEMDEDEDNEQAYFEIAEYVRISALLCFTELGVPPETKNQQDKLH